MQRLFVDHLFTGSIWIEGAYIEVDPAGDIASVTASGSPEGATRLPGCVLPGVPNLHCHAHQRAMAGLAERSGPESSGSGVGDSFWTWREVMYRHVGRMSPDDLEAVAAQLYVEMLEAGYTAVGEFQYLHHDPQGKPYDALAEMSLRCLAAAEATGIGLTSLPVLYTSGGFGGQAPTSGQRRFLCAVEPFLHLAEALERHRSPNHTVGIAPHSLRAVSPDDLTVVLDGFGARGPIHIHVAEQTREVDDCLTWSGQRPVAWLLDHAPVDEGWCLIHATHMDDAELAGLARRGAVAGLCPTTEANLGDGLFRAGDFLAADGRLGIGSDSNSSVSPVEELRWLEYGQRLETHRRSVLAGGAERSTGRHLLELALAGGAQACGRAIGRLAAGCRADFVVLDTGHPLLAGRSQDAWIDSWLFAGNRSLIREVWVGGARRVVDGRHLDAERVAERFGATMQALLRRS